jgi:hypothetical protein
VKTRLLKPEAFPSLLESAPPVDERFAEDSRAIRASPESRRSVDVPIDHPFAS